MYGFSVGGSSSSRRLNTAGGAFACTERLKEGMAVVLGAGSGGCGVVGVDIMMSNTFSISLACEGDGERGRLLQQHPMACPMLSAG